MTSTQLDYFVTCISYKSGAEAVVDPDFVWSDVLDIVSEAAGDGNPILFVHHIKGDVCEDRTIEALDATLNHLSDNGNTLTSNQRDWVEHHFSIATANHFRQEALQASEMEAA